jgi:hypothetical protein
VFTLVNSANGSNFNDIYTAFGFIGTPPNGNFNQFEGLDGDDDITGNGSTTIAYANAAAAVTVDLSTVVGSAHGTALGDVANVGSDRIFGGVNGVVGSGFGDSIIGGSGNETFQGQNGADTIFGNGGNDTLTGGLGDDIINGGNGTDMAVYTGASTDYTITAGSVTDNRVQAPGITLDGTDTLTSIEVLQFSDGYQLLSSGTLANPIDTAGLGIFGNTLRLAGTTNNDFLRLGSNLLGHQIDLGDGTGDTVLLGPGPGFGFGLNLLNVENVVGTANNDSISFATTVNGLSIDLGLGGSDGVTIANGSSSLSLTGVEFINSSDFTIIGLMSNDTLTLLNQVSGLTVDLFNGTNMLNLAAGTNTLGTVFNVATINGTSSADVLTFAGAVFNSTGTNVHLGIGNDVLNLNANPVTVVYSTGDGADTITGFNNAFGHHIDLSGVGGIHSLDDVLSFAHMDGSDTVIDFGGSDSIRLQGVNVGSLTGYDFGFGPVLSGDNITVSEGANGVTKVFGVHVNDDDPAAILSVTATADHGTLNSIPGTTESAINAQFALPNGVVYTPTGFNNANQVDDVVTMNVTDNHGLTDALHFVFQQSGPGGTALTGTGGKDLIFSTGGDDTLTGLSGQDNFVFSSNFGHDTVTDFMSGQDHIDLRALTAAVVNDSNVGAWLGTHVTTSLANSADTLITLDSGNVITLHNVTLGSLHTSDFIVAPH